MLRRDGRSTQKVRSRRTEDVIMRHMAMVEMEDEGLSCTAIARALGCDHSTVLYHVNGQCKCLPKTRSKDSRIVALRRELLAIQERVLACQELGEKVDYYLVQALRRALILAGEKPRVG
jgi:methylphosphotriester-DNA--protein-cysteine methyltransferase